MHTTIPTADAPPHSPFTIPNSPLTLVIGDPGIGKSLLSLDLAARLSRADPLPFPLFPNITTTTNTTNITNITNTPASSLILNLDDSNETTRSRLRAMNANPSHIALAPRHLTLTPDSVLSPQSSTLLRWLTTFLPLLPNPRLLILDPLPPLLGQADHNPHAVLTNLQPLLHLATTHHLHILAILHMNKSRSFPSWQNPLHLATGSALYPTLAPTAYLLTHPRSQLLPREFADLCLRKFPNQRTTRLLLPLKSPTQSPPSLAFTITPSATLDWHPTPLSHSPLYLPHNPMPLPDPSKLDIALDFLQKTLQNGPIPTQILQKRALSHQISPITLKRARRLLALRPVRQRSQWHLSLLNQNPPI